MLETGLVAILPVPGSLYFYDVYALMAIRRHTQHADRAVQCSSSTPRQTRSRSYEWFVFVDLICSDK